MYAELWVPVGVGVWHEGIITAHETKFVGMTWDVIIEQSSERSSVFRMQPYVNHSVVDAYCQKDDVYVHIEERDKVYIEPFTYHFYIDANNNQYYNISQRCPENDFDSVYYGVVATDNTITFPVGSFEFVAPCWLNDPTWISSDIHKIVFPEGLLENALSDETWINIGSGGWSDFQSIAYDNTVDFWESTQTKGFYRANPYSEFRYNSYDGDYYVKIHAENPSKVYLEPFNRRFFAPADDVSTIRTISQRCIENGFDEYVYGVYADGKITIPSGAFIATISDDTYEVVRGPLIINMPEGYLRDIENGVYMGLVSFSDEYDNYPISALNGSTKYDFVTFVDDMQMGNATLLYYAVDQAIDNLLMHKYPKNLKNVMLITFTDGLDQGSLAKCPEHRTQREYASYLSERISNTYVQGQKLQAYAIGLKSNDVVDDELFMYNLSSVASSSENVFQIQNVDELHETLVSLYEDLNRQTTQRVITISVPMMSHGDTYRFTLDGTTDDANNSNMWFEGIFNIDNVSLENITYHGFASASGEIISAEIDGVYLKFTLEDCRDEYGEILPVENGDIDQWTLIESRNVWQHNVENNKEEMIKIEDVKSSVAIMFALDCSSSLGDLFPVLKTVAKSFIDRLSGGNGDVSGMDAVVEKTFDVHDDDVEMYDLRGLRVTNPTPGIYVCRKGEAVKKVIIK